MQTSIKYSNLVLRLGLAIVFLWFGIDKFIHPGYWLSAWVPPWLSSTLTQIKIDGTQFVLVSGIFEVLVAISLVTKIILKPLSTLAVVFLLSILFINGLSEVTIRDTGLVGGFLSLILWPDTRNRF